MTNNALAGSYVGVSRRANRLCLPLSGTELRERGLARVELHAFTTEKKPVPLPVTVLESRPLSGQIGSVRPSDAWVPPLLRRGQTVKFGSDEPHSALDYLGFGWSDLEKYGVNSAGPAAELEFLVEEGLEDFELIWNLKCRNEKEQRRAAVVTLNGDRLAELELNPDKLTTSVVSCANALRGRACVRFELLHATQQERLTLRYVGVR